MDLCSPYSRAGSGLQSRTPSSSSFGSHISVMRIRTRKFFGTIFLLVLVVVWSLLGMTVAQTPWLAASGLLQAIFYVVAGLGWVLPAMPIVSWMAKPDPEPSN
ncbi:MAG: hypothetical protein JWQ94_4136 [Tardiphaga sp.]|jgi:hypothetical protein|nr:hypothetical protein [Tardiphaga sp.]